MTAHRSPFPTGSLLPALGLLAHWYNHGDPDDLPVILDAFEESRLSNYEQPYQRVIEPLKAPLLSWNAYLTRRDRAHAAAHVIWPLAYSAHLWQPSDDELRHLLGLALQVRRSEYMRSWEIVGGTRGRIDLTGLLRLAGETSNERFPPRISTIEHFVSGGSRRQFESELRHDAELDAEIYQ